MDDQLTQAHTTLTNTRNTVMQTIGSLPQEILALIFVQCVYDPHNEDYPFPVKLDMHARIPLIHRRLYSLLAVCRSWRDVGQACKALWSLFPLHVSNAHPRSQPRAAEINLQRAGSKNLHLAVYSRSESPRNVWLETFAGHWHRFSTINLYSYSPLPYEIGEVLETILTNGTPETISKLSLNHQTWAGEGRSLIRLPQMGDQLSNLINSLEILRISSVDLDWARINFTHRLTELLVDNIDLTGHSEVTAFLRALSSAHELRDLKIISTSIKSRGGEDLSVEVDSASNQVSLPRLEFLHLERLPPESLRFFLATISPAPYFLTLNLGDDIPWTRPPGDILGGTEFCQLLEGVTPYKLILSVGEFSLWQSGLRNLLKSIPTIKILVMNDFHLDSDLLRLLSGPSASPPRPLEPTHTEIFPKLETLEFHRASLNTELLGDLRTGFQDLLRSHPIRRMILGVGTVDPKDYFSVIPLNEADEVFGWLADYVPEFYLSPRPNHTPEAWTHWELWDI